MASRIVDLVHFSSPVMENNELMRIKAKEKFWDGIVVPWERVEEYIREDDCVVIGPGMVRESGEEAGDKDTGDVTNYLLKKFMDKKWVVDGGALQEMDRELLNERMIVTPHQGEFIRLFGEASIEAMAKKYKCMILLKGVEDVVCSQDKCVRVSGGNEGMTKGGTGDVLAGIIVGLAAKNPPLLAAAVGAYVVKKTAEKLFLDRGYGYNADDVADRLVFPA